MTRRGEKEPKKPCVLFIAHLPPPVHGVTVMSELIANSQLLKQNFEIRVIPLQFANTIAEIGQIQIKKLYKAFVTASNIILECLFLKPDLAYLTLTPTGFSFYRDLIYVAILKAFRIKRVFHLHGQGIAAATNRRWITIIYGWAFRESAVILLSDLLYEDIRSVASKSNCFILPNAIHDPEMDLTTRGFRNVPPNILYFSNLSEKKGCLVLLDALSILARTGISFRATFAGSWASEAIEKMFFSKLEEYSIEPYVEYLGPQYGEDKWRLFNRADIFVLPSFTEAFPLVVLEAMAASLPVVAANVGGIPDMIRDGANGFLVSPGNSEMLADCLIKLVNDPELRADFGRSNRQKFLRDYGVERFEAGLKEVFDTVIVKGNRKRRDAVEWHSEAAIAFDKKYANDRFFKDRFAVWVKLIDKYVSPEMHVLDAGCGSGLLSVYTAHRVRSVTGVDASSRMLELCEEKKAEIGLDNVNFLMCDFASMENVINEKMDLIICSSVLEYLDDLDKSLAILSSLSKKGSLLILSMPNRRSIYRKVERFVFCLTRRPKYLKYMRHVSTVEEMRVMLREHGFNILETTYIGKIRVLSRMLHIVRLPQIYESLFIVVAQRT
jgi:glycosyltransferase involved in cell wall biosynthesis/ubiquinone/menaquinone biosynthesis C-methylase UbiE